ncbi:FtsX-like permease family protein [Promicromonospora iranensis]|uniref:ABC transport system permease protein n=1 Tax=Promicromonospora iranensis TaxID=1105144 RepID=A0ABU2CW78_9MICO|nr:FtsX-like permease family protein [Promicromonospora iranensis]MDR7385614.1 putative ABC transport system permease protein [Promicromonospora iranensis]
MWSFARSAVRAYRSSFIGSFLIVMSAAALLSANGVLMESGLRGDAPLLTTVAASFAGTAILVVVLVVASTFASALRQRNAQFALLRAVGATPTQVRAMVTAEVAIVFALAAPLGAVPGLFAARLLTPVLESGGIVPGGFELAISPLPVVGSLFLLFPTALLAARLAAREVTKASPTAAVRGASVEPSSLSGARRTTAVALLVSGLLVAGTPFIVPGTLGSAAGATSAFLLISAAALAGPAVVGMIARRAAHATRSSSNAAVMLALVNSRGFSRRLTTAIIPLALFLALGTVQTGVNGSMVDAAGMQLRAGLGSAVVITSADGVTTEQAAAVASTPGIDAVVASSTVPAEVKVDSDEDLGGLSWEQTGLRVVSGGMSGLVDVGVTAGSMDDLTGPSTIAVSSESLFATGKGVGDTVELRFDGGAEVSSTIVAVYDRGLGFGGYIIGESSLPSSDREAAADVLFAQGSADLAPIGLQTVSVDDYVDETVAGAASQQELGAILLFVLIFFLAVAAANTLVMLTSARRPEFVLLRRIGTTRRQLASMISVESVFVMVMAWAIGTLSVIPALVGVAYGMLGGFSPAIEWPVYGALSGAVVLITSAATMVPARIAGRARNR